MPSLVLKLWISDRTNEFCHRLVKLWFFFETYMDVLKWKSTLYCRSVWGVSIDVLILFFPTVQNLTLFGGMAGERGTGASHRDNTRLWNACARTVEVWFSYTAKCKICQDQSVFIKFATSKLQFATWDHFPLALVLTLVNNQNTNHYADPHVGMRDPCRTAVYKQQAFVKGDAVTIL